MRHAEPEPCVVCLDRERTVRMEAEQRAEEAQCAVCMEAERTVAFVPCGHRCACEQCAEGLPRCPMCQKATTQVIKIYL